jgi:hypothetical protein
MLLKKNPNNLESDAYFEHGFVDAGFFGLFW